MMDEEGKVESLGYAKGANEMEWSQSIHPKKLTRLDAGMPKNVPLANGIQTVGWPGTRAAGRLALGERATSGTTETHRLDTGMPNFVRFANGNCTVGWDKLALGERRPTIRARRHHGRNHETHETHENGKAAAAFTREPHPIG